MKSNMTARGSKKGLGNENAKLKAAIRKYQKRAMNQLIKKAKQAVN